MHWLLTHPYASSIAGVVFVLVIGFLVFTARSDVEPVSVAQTWGSIGADLTSPIGIAPVINTRQDQENLYSQVKGGAPFQYTPLPPHMIETGAEAADEFDFDAFITSLTRPSGTKGSNPSDTALTDAYAFIPGGLISTSTPTKERTALQSAIYEYGNEAGGYIQSYDALYPNASQILKDQFEDRTNSAKNARLLGLADAMIGVGNSLQNIEITPPSLKPAHDKLAKSYAQMGTQLKAIAKAKNDETMLDAILAYNASVEAFTKDYVALASLFSAYGVTFKPDEPGSAFVFTNAPSL